MERQDFEVFGALSARDDGLKPEIREFCLESLRCFLGLAESAGGQLPLIGCDSPLGSTAPSWRKRPSPSFWNSAPGGAPRGVSCWLSLLWWLAEVDHSGDDAVLWNADTISVDPFADSIKAIEVCGLAKQAPKLPFRLRLAEDNVVVVEGRQRKTRTPPAILMTEEDLTILEAIAEEYPMAVTQPDLEGKTHIRRQKISERLRWLESKGLVKRPEGTKRKGRAITPAGLSAIGWPLEARH